MKIIWHANKTITHDVSLFLKIILYFHYTKNLMLDLALLLQWDIRFGDFTARDIDSVQISFKSLIQGLTGKIVLSHGKPNYISFSLYILIK
jgi:hypothetical protein